MVLLTYHFFIFLGSLPVFNKIRTGSNEVVLKFEMGVSLHKVLLSIGLFCLVHAGISAAQRKSQYVAIVLVKSYSFTEIF